MLITCVAYTHGQRLADIPVADISDYIQRPDTFVWVALKDPAPDELDAMRDEFGLHPLAVEDAQHGHQRPKLEEYGASLFLVLHQIDTAPDGSLRTGELDIFAGPQFVVSVRRQSEQGFADVRRRCESEPDLLRHGAGYVLYALMDAVVDRYVPVLDQLRADFERVEARIFSGTTTRAQIQALYSLKQKLAVLDHAVVPLVEVLGKLHGGRVPQVCSGLIDYFRDVYDHLLRLKQSIDSLRDTLATAISVNLSLIALQESEVTKRLAAYGALIAVPTAIAGVYGMNFSHMPELHWQFGYPTVLAAMGVVDLYLVYRFRKSGWM